MMVPVGLDGLKAGRRLNLSVNDELPHLLALCLNLFDITSNYVAVEDEHDEHGLGHEVEDEYAIVYTI